jgi:hypothetical protein
MVFPRPRLKESAQSASATRRPGALVPKVQDRISRRGSQLFGRRLRCTATVNASAAGTTHDLRRDSR